MAIIYKDFLTVLPRAHEFDGYISGLCPFHDDTTPSILVKKDGWFQCLACERRGTWKTLWNKLKGQPILTVPESRTAWGTPAIRIDDMEEALYQANDDLLHFPSLGWYLEMRGIDGRIEVNELGYYHGWYSVPVFASNGLFITGVLRASPPVQEATGLRYWCPHKPVPFVPDWKLVEESDYVIVVFGIFDALALSDIRQPVVTSTGGKNSFDPAWLESYRKPIYVIPDLKEEKCAMQLAKFLGWRGEVRIPPYPEGKKDCAGFLEAGRRDDMLKYFAEYK